MYAYSIVENIAGGCENERNEKKRVFEYWSPCVHCLFQTRPGRHLMFIIVHSSFVEK